MISISRRHLFVVSGCGIASVLLPTVGASAATKSVILVAREGTFDPREPSLSGMTVCASGVGSTGDMLARKERALVVNVPLRARIDAVRQGRCSAAIFVSKEKSAQELIEEIMVFFYPLEGLEFVELPLN